MSRPNSHCTVITQRQRHAFLHLLGTVVIAGFAGCANMPNSGPMSKDIQGTDRPLNQRMVKVVDIDESLTQRLAKARQQALFSEVLSKSAPHLGLIGRGDTVEVALWESPPAVLFGTGGVDSRTPSSVRGTVFPEQMVDVDGSINVPFAGRIQAAGLKPQAIEAEVARRLKGKANQPEILVRVTRNASATVTVVGEVSTSTRMPLTAGGERLLDALAAAGGVRQPVGKTMLQVTRGERYHTLPLDVVIRDPRQNVPLQPGDVLTALFQPLSFTALGATGKNEEVPFEGQGITLAQALARAGGLQDQRSDVRGLYIFRMEDAEALAGAEPAASGGIVQQVPVVYRLDLSSPRSFFAMQQFAMANKDVLYISNAPAVELQKFLNLMFSVIYPLSATQTLLK